MNTLPVDERRRELEDFANAGAQPNQPAPGGAVMRTTALTPVSERIIGAQKVAVHRDIARVLRETNAISAAAGSDWFYRYPVTDHKTGKQSWIEGPSIKLANDVARIFGNDSIEVRDRDEGDAWVFTARFSDHETGFSMERLYRQRKSQVSIRSKDYDRQLDIAYQIGQSKAIRNCIVNSLQIYADYAFECAQKSLVDKIGKDLPKWRQQTVEGIARIPVELNRVERVIGRAARDWVAHNVAQVVAMMKSIADGMATIEETFPPIEVPPPAAQDTPPATDTQQKPAKEPAKEAADEHGSSNA